MSATQVVPESKFTQIFTKKTTLVGSDAVQRNMATSATEVVRAPSPVREGAKLTGGTFETKLAAAFKVIADDEDGHVDHAAADLKDVIQTEADFEAARKALLEVSMQRLHMRNEMFSDVMSPEELNGYLSERGGEPIDV